MTDSKKGFTQRELFAAAALTGLIASHDRGGEGRLFDMDEYAQDAWGFADAMVRNQFWRGPIDTPKKT